MHLQGRKLQHGMVGEDVRLLQTELLQLGFVIPENEQIETHFGVGTLQTVIAFQEQHNLPQNGIVDEITARAINATHIPQFGKRLFGDK